MAGNVVAVVSGYWKRQPNGASRGAPRPLSASCAPMTKHASSRCRIRIPSPFPLAFACDGPLSNLLSPIRTDSTIARAAPTGCDRERVIRMRLAARLRWAACLACGTALAFSAPQTLAQGNKGAAPAGDWRTIDRDSAATRYSPLDDINRGNVTQLQQAWTY